MKDTIVGKIVLSPKRCDCNATSEDEYGVWEDESALMREHIGKLERREDSHMKQIEKLERDNALMCKVMRAAWGEVTDPMGDGAPRLLAALKAAEAAMEGE